MTDTTNAITQGAHHIGLTVPNLDQTRGFFVETLGYEQVGEVPDYPAAFLSDGNIMITLWQAADPDNAVSFDRKNNFAPEPLGDLPVQHMMCYIPGGVRVEIIAPNA